MSAAALDLLDILRSGGLPHGVAAAEQLSFLLLILYLDREEGEHPAWSELVRMTPEARYQLMREQAFDDLVRHSSVGASVTEALDRAVFDFPSAELLKVAVQRLDALSPRPFLCADILDVCIEEASATSQVASPRTPRAVSYGMLTLTAPGLSDRVLDPAAGAGDRLLALSRYRGGEGAIRGLGFEVDATMVRIGALRLFFHGVEDAALINQNVLAGSWTGGEFDVVLCQPPFGGLVDPSVVAHLDVGKAARSEILFAERALRALAPGGRSAMVMPANVAFSSAGATMALRRRWVEAGLRAVVALPAGTFRPYTNVETILVVVDGATRGAVAFVNASERDDGLSSSDVLDRCADEVAALLEGRQSDKAPNDRFGADRAFVVSNDEIRSNGYSLLARTYRPEEQPDTVRETPEELLREIRAAEDEISAHLSDLSDRLADRASGRG